MPASGTLWMCVGVFVSPRAMHVKHSVSDTGGGHHTPNNVPLQVSKTPPHSHQPHSPSFLLSISLLL